MNIDGCSKGNPGQAGAGSVMRDEGGVTVFELSEPLGERTSNEAESLSLILGLERVVSEHDVGTLVVRSDSELLVNQMNGDYKVKKPELKALKERADLLVRQLKGFRIEQVPREQNEEADRLSDEAVRGKGARRPVGRYISTVDIERYCTARCEGGKFGDGHCRERACHLLGFTSEVLKL